MSQRDLFTLGIDIGSTTVKIAVLDEKNELLFSDYERHFANIQETLSDLLGRAVHQLGPIHASPVITGSGGLTLAKHLGVPFRPGSYRRIHGFTGLCTADRCCHRARRRGREDHLF